MHAGTRVVATRSPPNRHDIRRFLRHCSRFTPFRRGPPRSIKPTRTRGASTRISAGAFITLALGHRRCSPLTAAGLQDRRRSNLPFGSRAQSRPQSRWRHGRHGHRTLQPVSAARLPRSSWASRQLVGVHQQRPPASSTQAGSSCLATSAARIASCTVGSIASADRI
jgi:hypothetical protein